MSKSYANILPTIMKKKLSIMILISTFPILAIGQGFAKVDTIQLASDELIKLTNREKILLIESVDFTGDHKKDFIISTKLDKNEYIVCEYWISSDLKKVRKVQVHKDGIQIRKFINLDTDPELEIVDASGYEDGIDYTIQNLNLKSGKLSTVLYFNPVIETKGKHSWGYPWDWERLKINSNGQIKTSLNHTIERDGNSTIPEKQKIMPVIYFHGTPSQESNVKGPQEIEWLTINEIINKSK